VRLLLTLTAAVALLAGSACSSSPPEPAVAPPDGPAATASPEPAEPLVIDVDIAEGRVSPTNQQFTATRGQPILIQVDSDTADQLHVHSTPEQTFEVKPEPGQAFRFTVEVPGRVDVELHQAHRVIATIAVR
jgi:hypothetical protein